MKGYFIGIVVILLTLTEFAESIALQQQRGFSSDDNLLPLKRQEKSVRKDLEFFFPESVSLFRERQRHAEPSQYAVDTDPDVLGSVKRSLSSAFAERRHILDEREKLSKNRKKKMLAAEKGKKKKKRNDDLWAYAIEQESRKPMHQHKRKNLDPQMWDSRFPGLNLRTKRRRGSPPNDPHYTGDRESLLQHLAWNSMSKRLLLVDGEDGLVVDRGERRRRIEKRTSAMAKVPPVNKEELDRILADDANKSRDGSKTIIKLTSDANEAAGSSRTRGMTSASKTSKEQEPFKGKEWVPPTDSDRTLRSKKSWDDYFGVDKRNSGTEPERSENVAIGGKGHGEDKDEELGDVLVQWYFDKMLKHVIDQEPNFNEASGKAKQVEEMVKRGWKEENEEVPLKAVEERLKKIEDVILMKAIRLLEEQMEEENGEEDEEEGGDDPDLPKKEAYFLEHLKAAYSLEKMRNDLQEFEESLIKLKFLDEEEDETRKRNKEMFSMNDDRGDVDDDGDEEDDKKRMKKNNDQDLIKPAFVAKGSAEVASPLTFYGEDQDDYSNDEPFSITCPVWTEAVNYCNDLGQALGDVGLALTRSCVEHMLCYTCEGSSSSCDALFLRRAMSLCSEDFRCQAMAGAMRSVFLSNHDDFRRRNHAFCVRDQCLAKLVARRKK